MEDYKKYYESLDTLRIVSILRNPSDFNSDAINAATEELKQRNLSSSALRSINETLDEQSRDIQAKINKTKKLKRKTREKLNTAFEIANPQLTSPDSIKIKSFSTLLIANSLYALISQWEFLNFAFTHEMSRGVGPFELLQIVLIILPLIAGVTFWRKMKIGYYLAISISGLGILAYILILVSLFLNDYISFVEKIPNAIFSLAIISILAYAVKFLLQENIKKLYLDENK